MFSPSLHFQRQKNGRCFFCKMAQAELDWMVNSNIQVFVDNVDLKCYRNILWYYCGNNKKL